jgi:hypothetical protein
MSLPALVVDGARRAAALLAMLFTLNAPAERPPHAPPVAPLAIEGSISASGLTLAAHHLDVRIADDRASVLTSMRLRNDTAAAIAVHYQLPHPARLRRGEPGQGDGAGPRIGAAADLSVEAAELLEAAEPVRHLRRGDAVVLASGETVTIEVLRELPLAIAGGVRRLRLPLPVDREAPWVPRFTADVWVDAGQPIRRLASPTHAPALVDGLGSASAMLSLPDGFVYRQERFEVEFELAPGPTAPALALERTQPRR